MSGNALFRPGIVAAVLAAGALAFVVFLWLTAYAPDLRSGRDGGAHALSNGATGFRALGDLLDATGGRVFRAHRATGLFPGGLLVLTPTPATDPKLLARMVRARKFGRTLIILPKWNTVPVATGKTGWVSGAGFAHELTASRLLGELAPGIGVETGPRDGNGRTTSTLIDAFASPRHPQSLRGDAIEPLVVTPGGGALVARLADAPRVFVGADPDIFNTMGLRDRATAVAAIGLLDHMTEGADRVVTFDLTLNGFDGGSNLGKLAFEPPFLAATLCLLVAAALAGWGAFFPLGPAIRECRAIGFGKRALVDSSADLLMSSGREALIAERYVALTRDAAAAKLGLSLEDDTARLDALGFGAVAANASAASGRAATDAALGALARWKREVA